MRDRKLTGPWAGFAFKCGRLVTPEGRELEPQDLAWLSLTAALAQEWRRMMAEASQRVRDPRNVQATYSRPLPDRPAEIVDLREVLASRTEKPLSRVMTGPDAEPPAAALPIPGPRPSRRG